VGGVNGNPDPSARGEFAVDRDAAGIAGGDEVFEDAVDDFLVEAAGVAVGGEVELERLRLDAELGGDIADADRREIGLAGDRAHRGEFRAIELDPIIPLRVAVGKGLQRCGEGGRRVGCGGFAKKAE